MSRERCLSLDEKQKSNRNNCGGHIPGRSSNRSPQRTNGSPHNVPSTPEICRSNYQGQYGFPQNQFEPRRLFQYGCDDVNQSSALEPWEAHPEYYTVKSSQLEDLPDEMLDEYTEPSYYEPPANASFDDLMCVLASPQTPLQQTNHLEEIAGMMTPDPINIDDGRRRIFDHRTETKADDPLCPYGMEPQPDDPNVIPPHPKDPKDVVGVIRRARAIQRLRALEEEAARNLPNPIEKHGRSAAVSQKTRVRARKSQPSTLEPSQRGKAVVKKKKERPPNVDHTPDYIDPEFAAGITNNNSKFLKKSKSPPPHPTQSATPLPPTYESIMERAAAVCAKTYSVLTPPRKNEFTPKSTQNQMSTTELKDQLDEFEALEELYNAQPDQCTSRPREENVNVVVDRIDDLQRQLFQSPAPNDCSSPSCEIPPIIRYYDLMKRHEEMLAERAFVVTEVCQVPEYKDDLEQIHGIADVSGSPVCSSPTGASSRIASTHTSPTLLPAQMPPLVCPQDYNNTSFDNAFLQNMETPAGFLIQDEVALGDISMPNVYEEDATIYEMALEDITSPELDDLSVSLPDALEPDYPLELSDYESEETVQIVEDEEQKSSGGFLTSVVSAMVDKLRNMFTGSSREVEEDAESIHLDSSLPNLFETTPPQKLAIPSAQKPTPHQTVHKATDSERPIVIPAHPKDPTDYATMVKRAQLIQKLKAQEAAETVGTKVMKIPKARPPPSTKAGVAKKTKSDQRQKIYPLGEYSPGYVAPVARARVIAGYKNRSAVLNPQRAARIAVLEAAEESLPPVERMQKKIARIIEKRGQLLCARPSIETLGTLQAIKECMPKTDVPQPSIPKWTPAVRRVNKRDRVFSKKFERVFGKIKPMTPIKEETYGESDLMRFSPLRPHEGRLRLQYLNERSEQMPSQGEVYPRTSSPRTPETDPVQYSPITLRSPSSPSTGETRTETVTTKLGENGGEESIREEVIETSTMENGQVHTTTRKITTKTDEFGNVTCHLEEGRGLAGDTIIENIDTIEAPEFLDVSDIPPPRDSSMPSPSEIIERIRVQVQQKLKLILPQVATATEEPAILQFPEDLSYEQLFDIEIPDMEMTPILIDSQASNQSPNVSLPYCWGEMPTSTYSQISEHCPPNPTKVVSPVPQRTVDSHAGKSKSLDSQIVIPAHPKDPTDYVTIVKRAQAIQKLRKQQEEAISALAHPQLVGPSHKDQMTKSKKKKPPKSVQQIKEDAYRECPAEPPSMPADYVAAVARARQLAGYKNITADLNTAVGEKLAANNTDEALPAYQKILQRMEKVRRAPTLKRKIEPTADVLGTIAAIRGNISPIQEEVRPPPTSCAAPVPTQVPHSPSMSSPESDKHQDLPDVCLDLESDGQVVESQVCPPTQKSPRSYRPSPDLVSVDKSTLAHIADISLEEFEALEKQMACSPQVNSPTNTSLDEFEALERQMAAEADNSGLREYRKVSEMKDFDKRLVPAAECYGAPVDKQTFYDELIADFGNKQRDVLQVEILSDLMASTPVCPKERIRQIKEAQQKPYIPRNIEVHEEAYVSPTTAYSPITLLSPSEAHGQNRSPDVSPVQTAKDEVILDLHTPKMHHARPKQFRDLEGMPFDELEFEDEPTLTNVSFDKAQTPPPQPSELINRIRQQIHKRLREEKSHHSQIWSFGDLQFPDELPEEELFELSAPSLVQSPISQTPCISLPYAWREITSPTPSPAVSSSPLRTPIRTRVDTDAIVQCPKIPSPDGPLVIPPHPRDPKDYAAMVKRAQAIHKLKKQKDAENTIAVAAPKPPKKKIRIPPLKLRNAKPKAKLTMKKHTAKSKEQIPPEEDVTRDCPLEPPPLPADYAEAVARARQLAGYKNTTAALNPEAAAQIALEKAADEAEAAAFAGLTEHEKLKVRMDRIRSKVDRNRRIKPTIEQLAFLQHLKEKYKYATPNVQPSRRQTVEAMVHPPLHRLSDTPRPSQNTGAESSDLAEFEALEKMVALQGQFCQAMPHGNIAFRQRIVDPQEPLEVADTSLAEYQAIEAPPDQCPALPPATSFQLIKRIADMQQQQLATPPQTDPRERYKELLMQMQALPKTPVEPSPVKTPEMRYSPIHFSPTSPRTYKRADKPTMPIRRGGDNTITEEVTASGEMQHENKHVEAIDISADIEELEEIGEPSYLAMTPISPTDAPRPRDIINRIQRDVHCRVRPEVPTARLIELRTPPRELPLPKEVLEETLIEMTCPTLLETPPRTPTHSPRRSPERAPNSSIPEFFIATPPVSPLRHTVPSLESPITIPSHPKDPTDYATMVKRARKMHQLKVQEEAEARAAAEAAQLTRTEASKLKKMKKIPISNRTTPLLKKVLAGTRKLEAGPGKSAQYIQRECPTEPPPLPEGYAEHVARARHLAGLKNSTTAKITAAAVDATVGQGTEGAKVNFGTLMSRIASLREKGSVLQAQPSMETAAYLGALKSVMDVMDPTPTEEIKPVSKISSESPKTRYRKIMNARLELPLASAENSQVQTPPGGDIPYTPIRFISPRVGDDKTDVAAGISKFNMANFEGLQDLGELDELEEPSLMDIEGYTVPPQSPRTPQPQPSPSRLIRRIREDVQQKLAANNLICPTPIRTPSATPDLPSNVTEEDLFEMSVPFFVETPQKQPTPARSPNISIPLYFETTPKIPTPKAESPLRSKVSSASGTLAEEESPPLLLDVCSGVRVKTPEGSIVIPPHPKDPDDVLAMIRRAQLIRKLEVKRDADEAEAKRTAHKLLKGARVPISRRLRGTPARKVQKPPRTIRKLLEPIDKSECDVPAECPMEPCELPPRELACLRNTTDLLNPSKPPQDYATIMARAAAVKAKTGQIQPTARELAAAQNLINRRQKLERGRQLSELEQRRRTQCEDVSLNFDHLQTPPPVMERFRKLKARMPSETPITSRIPYSPVKTPVALDLPVYTPIHLAPSPPCPFLQNISEPAIGNVSMPAEFLSDYDDMDINVESNNDLQQQTFDLNRRIQFLQNQYLRSPRHISISPRAASVLPNSFESPGLAEFEALERDGGVLQPSSANPSQRTDIKQMVDDLNRLVQISRAQEKLLCEGDMGEKTLPRSNNLRATTQQETIYSPRKSPVIGEYSALDSFEAMERLCRTPHQR